MIRKNINNSKSKNDTLSQSPNTKLITDLSSKPMQIKKMEYLIMY